MFASQHDNAGHGAPSALPEASFVATMSGGSRGEHLGANAPNEGVVLSYWRPMTGTGGETAVPSSAPRRASMLLEVSSHCNMHCTFRPSDELKRMKQHVSDEEAIRFIHAATGYCG